jgi:hypothetical protein
MNERKNIDREVTSIYLDGETLDEAISTLRQLAEAYGGSAVIRKTSMPYEDYDYLALFVSEPETDQEFQARLAREATELKRHEDREAAEFKRLSAKFAKAEGRTE